MRIALLSDVHANHEAFAACLAHLKRQPPDAVMLLGDMVGYGADPVACAAIALDLAGRGSVALRGNHDAALTDPAPDMNADALAAIRWTRDRLDARTGAALAGLPLTHRDGDILFVHAGANGPAAWPYVTGTREAERSLAATDARIVVAGHTHVPAVFALQPDGRAVLHTPRPGVPVTLTRHRRWHVVLGAVGQPRDGDPSAAYSVLDVAQGTITLHRVAYDVQAAAAKILAAGLPHRLAHRLAKGM